MVEYDKNRCINDNIKQFIFAGRAEFTILNTLNGVSHRYHVKANKDKRIYFVSVKIERGYKYAGFIKMDDKGNVLEYVKGAKGLLDEHSQQIKGLMWVIKNANNMHPAIKVLHHGRCAACGRELTDDESIRRGLGPICYERVLRFY